MAEGVKDGDHIPPSIVLPLPHVPARVGESVRIYQLARFYRALGMLQQAGIPIVQALDMVIGLLPAALHPSLSAARRDIGEGRSISSAFETHDA